MSEEEPAVSAAPKQPEILAVRGSHYWGTGWQCSPASRINFDAEGGGTIGLRVVRTYSEP